MKTKYAVVAAIAVVVVAGVVIFLSMSHGSSTSNEAMAPSQQASAVLGSSTAATRTQMAPGQATVTPISANVGSVAGVDLSGFAAEANQSAALAAQDGSSAAAMSADAQTIATSSEPSNSPIQ